MKKGKRILISALIIFVGIIFLKAFFINPASTAKRPSGKRNMEKVVVRVDKIKKADLKFILSYVGSLKAKDEVNVFSKVSGKLSGYLVNEGDSVTKGATIALVDRDETGLKFELAKVESPISGIVGRTLLDKGANVLTVSQDTPVAVILNMDEMIVRIAAPEEDLAYLKVGLKVEVRVDAYPDEVFNGEVSKVSEVFDTVTRTLPIEITISNKDHRLKSGLFCRINLIASWHKDAFCLSQDAVVQELGANYIFVMEDHIARKKKVSLGIQEDGLIEILDGLNENDKVIVFGQQGLRDGMSIEIAQD